MLTNDTRDKHEFSREKEMIMHDEIQFVRAMWSRKDIYIYYFKCEWIKFTNKDLVFCIYVFFMLGK